MTDVGLLAVTDAEGRFRFDPLSAGKYKLLARGPNGEEAKTDLVIPGQGAEISLAKPKAAAAAKS
jgi:hypothetical protein